MSEQAINNLFLMLVVVDPIGVAVIFAAMAVSASTDQRRQMALMAAGMAAAILVVFALFGVWLLHVLNISLPAFRIAGGALLFLLSIDMVFARQSGLRSTTSVEQDEAVHKQDISIFPLAFPLIAGPGAITSTLFIAAEARGSLSATLAGLGVILAVLVLTYLCLRSAERIVHLLGETGSNVIGRLLGLLLSALAVQYILDGLGAAFKASMNP